MLLAFLWLTCTDYCQNALKSDVEAYHCVFFSLLPLQFPTPDVPMQHALNPLQLTCCSRAKVSKSLKQSFILVRRVEYLRKLSRTAGCSSLYYPISPDSGDKFSTDIKNVWSLHSTVVSVNVARTVRSSVTFHRTGHHTRCVFCCSFRYKQCTCVPPFGPEVSVLR